jgi:hypothetical protein
MHIKKNRRLNREDALRFFRTRKVDLKKTGITLYGFPTPTEFLIL